MKGVPIKFRGITPKGEVVFGKCLTYTHMAEGEDAKEVMWIGDEDNGYHIVEDSLSQLIGYDYNGAEVYEGDALERFDPDPHQPDLTFAYFATWSPALNQLNQYSGKFQLCKFDDSVKEYKLILIKERKD